MSLTFVLPVVKATSLVLCVCQNWLVCPCVICLVYFCPLDGGAPSFQFCVFLVKIETRTVKPLAALGLAGLLWHLFLFIRVLTITNPYISPKRPLTLFQHEIFCDWQDIAEERAEKVFQQLDVNDDGELNEEEFVSGALKVLSTMTKDLKFWNSSVNHRMHRWRLWSVATPLARISYLRNSLSPDLTISLWSQKFPLLFWTRSL